MKQTKKALQLLALLLTIGGSAFVMTGCDGNMEDAADNTGDAIENAADETTDAVQDAAEETGDAVEDATN
ncbi:hypothetical protein [Puniceicoccus vermicola]|uniref:YtxH domain-containing protein n=1 Tax=Puniceicoccus vermicola TaxID=388746 RepID=A0A7X1AWH7_9BACT|nr:hypothetical protein [Puniceicoccus vermicola]MBC2601285.1 hypothetical protein [Puniceicoccus vermicola]